MYEQEGICTSGKMRVPVICRCSGCGVRLTFVNVIWRLASARCRACDAELPPSAIPRLGPELTPIMGRCPACCHDVCYANIDESSRTCCCVCRAELVDVADWVPFITLMKK
jgi:hypothetical protein